MTRECISSSGHIESVNPIKRGTCERCGGKMPEPVAPVVPTRDLAAEDEFLAEVVGMAERLTGIRPSAYPQRVKQRLDIGTERYPDNRWRYASNVPRIIEEPPDVAGYAVLELRRMELEGMPAQMIAEQRLDFLAASVHAAVSDWYCIRAWKREQGELED